MPRKKKLSKQDELLQAFHTVKANINCRGLDIWRLRDAEEVVLKALVQRDEDLHNLISAVHLWAGRPTKDGAKKLKALANKIEERMK